jgi:isocitrate lyase
MMNFAQQIDAAEKWCASPRFAGITRLYGAREVAEQQGTIDDDFSVARVAAERFYVRLRQLFEARQQITTFGPYSPGQAVAMKRLGIEGIYLGGWATSAKGSVDEDPGPDLASYPLSQVPNEAAALVRALLTADKNQHYLRSRMTDSERQSSAVIDYTPFIIADADTGHGGDAHVRNLIRRFVEVGVPGYHIEDQRPGAKKCGHQAGKVLVASDEQIKRLNAARLQLDIMRVPGLIVARTDAEAATFLENCSDERDQPFLLGATRTNVPSYKVGYLSILRGLVKAGMGEIRGHLLFAVSDVEYEAASAWLTKVGFDDSIQKVAGLARAGKSFEAESALEDLESKYSDTWGAEAGLKTYGDAVADAMRSRLEEGQQFEMSVDEWNAFAREASRFAAAHAAARMGIAPTWDCELPKTPDGFYQVQGGIEYAIAKSLAAAPFADLLWMETKTADLDYARRFAEAIHSRYPDQMLAYNLSPSFNWDTTGMSDDQMRDFPRELGKLGYVFNFITYGGHQIDGLAAEEFSTALQQDGMLALARLQRKLRLLESPYRTPQTLVGGPRLDGALMAVSGRTAATKAMGKGSTQVQHLVQTEVPTSVLEQWTRAWTDYHQVKAPLSVRLRPHTPGADLLELSIVDSAGGRLANVIFDTIHDRRGRTIMSVRDQVTAPAFRQKRLMTLAQLFLIYRYRVASVHYLTPTQDNEAQVRRMTEFGIFSNTKTEVGQIIVADVDTARVEAFARQGHDDIQSLLRETWQASSPAGPGAAA